MKFQPGNFVATPAAIEALQQAEQAPVEFIRRHLSGDWGDMCDEDKRLNDAAVAEGSRILSAYTLKTGQKLWIITEYDRSYTTILLPTDY